ncbi:MAG: hypothetical protein EA352_09725 [Gemmatimonadales bacterium]|nr:MAG: hypothetical protein EA352_09725 [Gemmatimonadales bacterium]
MVRTEGEIRLHTSILDPAESEPEFPALNRSTEEPDPDPGWSRWALAGDEGTLWLRPCLPDRPLVLQPEAPFVLLPRASARVFIRVPLWIRVEWQEGSPDPEAIPGEGTILTEQPVTTLSNTWWGDVMEGELAYWLETRARRVYRENLRAAHLAICPLVLENRSTTELQVDKLAFRTIHLGVFGDGTGFWGDESRVRYQGESEGSEVEVSGRPPEEAGNPVLVTPPRVPPVRGIRARTFQRLRGISTLGGWA